MKEEHKLLSELGGGAGGGGGGGTGAGNGTAAGGGYYEHSGYPGTVTSTELYDSLGTISTMTQAQAPHLYTPPIGGSIG